MAFFPCVRFENQIMLWFRGQCKSQKKWNLDQKMEYCIKLQNELTNNYTLINQLCIICLRKGLKLIIENPFSEEHYLRRYWCCEPKIIDYDRREKGDYYKKPTQYWFINCEPAFNIIFEVANDNALKYDGNRYTMRYEQFASCGAKNIKTARSMIHPDYANRFIREYIIKERNENG